MLVGFEPMKRPGRILSLALIVGLLTLSVAIPVLGQDEGSSSAPASDSGLTPAVELEPEAEADVLPDWTYRYMIPAGLVLAAVVILLTSIQYFTNVVRKRYRIVEE